MIHRTIGHIEEKNDSKDLVFSPEYKLIDKYEEVWKWIKNEIEAINSNKKLILWRLNLTPMIIYH